MSVFEWILVAPKGQGHTYVGAVATNFLMTAFIIMSENAPSCLLWSLTRISLHFCIDIMHLSTATVKQTAVFRLLLISSHSVLLHVPLFHSYCLLAGSATREF